MGKYINPPGKTKEQFLQEEGIRQTTSGFMTLESFDSVCDYRYVVLVENPFHTAALIVYNQSELEYMQRVLPTESRPYLIWMVPTKKLLPFLD